MNKIKNKKSIIRNKINATHFKTMSNDFSN